MDLPAAGAFGRRRGTLAPVELAEAAVLADLAVGLHLLGFLLPFGGALQAMAVTPFAALAARHRARALLVAAGCGAGVAFLVGGLHLSLWVVASALIGLAVGCGYRGGWGWARTTASAAILAGSMLAGVTAATLVVLPHLRQLSLAQVHIAWRGAARLLDHLGLSALTGPLTTAVDGALRWWWVSLPGLEVVAVGVGAVVARALALPALGRLRAAVGPPAPPLPVEEGVAGPVPVELEHVSHRYAGADRPALCDVSVRVERGRLTTVVGPNGSGKSTLAKLLLGMPPTAGRVRRPGVAALGRPGGTTLISQRPESQVLGVRVGDDISWGARSTSAAEVARVLAAVGLEGTEHQETATLSGGQLQRLAIAAALSRRPALVVSDESTSMLDPPGQHEVLAVLRRLVESGASTVVHVTHQRAELDGTAVIALEEGRLVPGPPSGDQGPSPAPCPRDRAACQGLESAVLPGEPLVSLFDVGYVYAAGTPWARRALSGVTLEIARGEVVAVVGPNAAGKSTLAWVLAGLLEPTEGQATIEATPLSARVGSVGMAFQHARLQLFRSSVERNLTSGTDLDRAGAAAALARVGLPTELLDRRIDDLSGGEQRRVALAGMLAHRPPLLVLDEPLAGLDTAGRRALAEVVAQLRASRDTAVVLISHDVAFASELADRTLRMEGGRLVERREQQRLPAGDGEAVPPRAAARARGRRRRAQPQLFRYVPGESPIHRLWAGTKLLSVAAFSVAASVHPSWPSEAVLGSIVALWMAVSRVGPRALPRPPLWLAAGLGIGAALALVSGGGAAVRVAGLRIGLSGLNQWAEFTCLILLLVLASLLVGLTTPVADVSPALSRLLSPLRRAHVPVDELVAGVALCVRCLTLLGEELRVLSAARRVRRPPRSHQRGLLELLDDGIDLLVTALVAAVRRAGELSFAIEARGGLPEQVPKGPAPGRRDAFALAVALAAAVAMTLV